LALFDAEGDRSVLLAADAAGALVFLALPTCDRSDAAALLAAFDADGERNVFPASDAAFGPVRPDRAIKNSFGSDDGGSIHHQERSYVRLRTVR
jgi:hypothetical protein